MRIITGIARGIKLETLEGEATRPTSEVVKEAIFSAIQFEINDRIVLDLFGGSGQMALEALSRGAAKATVVDNSRQATDIIKANAQKTGLFQKCRIATMDWKEFVKGASGREKYDLVILDPPYKGTKEMTEGKRDGGVSPLDEIIKRITAAGILSDDAIIVAESDGDGVPVPPDDMSCRVYRYGKTYVTIMRHDTENKTEE